MDRPSNRTLAALLFLLFVGFGLRLYGAKSPIWDDEAFTFFESHGGWEHLIYSISYDAYPPLFYLGEMAALKVFGHSLLALRALPLLWGCLGPVLVSLAFYRIEDNKGKGALLLFALTSLNPMLVYHSYEARAYSFLALAIFFNLSAFGLWSLKGGRLAFWTTICSYGLAIYSNYLAIFLPATHFFWALGNFRRCKCYLGVLLCEGLLTLPLIPFQQYQNENLRLAGRIGQEPVRLWSILRSYLILGPGPDYHSFLLQAVAYLFFFGASLWLATCFLRNRGHVSGIMATFVIVTFLVFWGLRIVAATPLRDTYFVIVVYPLFYCLTVGWLNSGRLKSLLALALVLPGFQGSLSLASGARGVFDLSWVAQHLQVHSTSGDGVILGRPVGDLACLAYYLSPNDPFPLPVAAWGGAGSTLEERWVSPAKLWPRSLLTKRSERIWLVGKDSSSANFRPLQQELAKAGFRVQFEQVKSGARLVLLYR